MTTPSITTDRVLADVLAERIRQDEKWGEQNHPDGTGQYPEALAADVARMACQNAAEGGHLDWLHILREEVAEAFAEADPARLRTELIQVAAVAVAWAEAIDRRAAAKSVGPSAAPGYGAAAGADHPTPPGATR